MRTSTLSVMVLLILISTLSLMVSGQVVTFTATGTRIAPDHPTYGDYEKPYFTTTITGVLATPRPFYIEHSFLFGGAPLDLRCKVYDASDTAGDCGLSQDTPPPRKRVVIEYKSQVRLPVVITLTDTASISAVIASYSFPGISPVTMTTMPLISFYPSATLDEWRYQVLNPQQEYTSQSTEMLYLCHVDECKTLSLNGDGSTDFFTFADSTELTLHADALSSDSALRSTTAYVKAPSERYAFVVPASNIEGISGSGDPALPLVHWPFVEGKTFEAGETPTTLSYIHRITDTTPEFNLVKVRWALWPATSTPTWYSQLPVDGGGNLIATDLRFHFPDVPLYTKYSKIVPVQANLDNSCTCHQSTGETSVCVPDSEITNSFQITAIECTFHVSKTALGDNGVLVEPYNDDSALSDPFLIQLSYRDSSSATIRTYINKAPMITRNFNLLLESLQWNLYSNNNNARTLGLVSYQGGDYVKETFIITITGFLSNQPIFVATQTGDQVVCRPSDLGAPSSDKAHIGTPEFGLTSWVSSECAYYRKVSSGSSIDYTIPGSTPTYTVTENSFSIYRANSLTGDPWSGTIQGIEMQISKPSFQPFPIPTSFPLPLILPLGSWDDEFSLTSSIPENNITDLSSIWYDAHTSTPRETIFTHTFTDRSSDPQYRLDGRSLSLTDITLPSCYNKMECKFQSSQDLSDPFVIYYKLSGDVDENKKDVVIFEAESSITGKNGGFVSHNQHIYLFKPNIVSAKRLIYLYNTDVGYVDIIYEQVQSNTSPIQLSSGEIDFDLTLCAESTDPILSYLGSALELPNIAISVLVDDAAVHTRTVVSNDGNLVDFCKTQSSFTVIRNSVPINTLFYFSVSMESNDGSLPIEYYSRPYIITPRTFTLTAPRVETPNTFQIERKNTQPLTVIPNTSVFKLKFSLDQTPVLVKEAGKRGLELTFNLPQWILFTSRSKCELSTPSLTTIVLFDKATATRTGSSYTIQLKEAQQDQSGNWSDNFFPPTQQQSPEPIANIECTFDVEDDNTDSTVYSTTEINTPFALTVGVKVINHDDSGYLVTWNSGPLNRYFIHRNSDLTLCRSSTNVPMPCIPSDLPIIEVKDTLPPLKPKLPQTIRSLTGHCEVVHTNKNTYEEYKSIIHERMCSIPISGMLTTVPVTQTIMGDRLVLPTHQTEFNMCDCRCKGYWADDIDNKDYKKCSKCSIPDCPTLFTPNSQCTACECSTPQCKRFTTNVFGMIYFKPQVLRYLIDLKEDSTNAQFNSVDLDKSSKSLYFSNPSQAYKSIYFTIMSNFATHLKRHIIDTTVTTIHQSTIQNVLITPLVEGSFTAWKITLSFTNGSQKPLSELAPLYGLPPLEQSLSLLFNDFIVAQYSLTSTTSSTFPTFISTAPLPLQSPTQFPLFTTDVIQVGCITRDNYDSGTVITAAMLHPCPLPNQYIPAKGNNTKADILNPLWSKCDSDQTISFINYESLLDTTTKTTSLKARQLYPYCFDFAGVNVGKEYDIPCGYNPSTDLLYNTASSTLLLPSYTTAMLGSFILPADADQKIKDRVASYRELPSPRFPSFPTTTVVLCHGDTKTTQAKRCAVDTYGDECQYPSIISPTSMTSSPTTVNPQSYAHVQWDFMGDNTQELTIVLYSTQKKNDGQGYFVWSQLLTTVPVASLYASAQVPTLDQSKLFEMVYDAIANGNNIDLVNIYSSSTNIAIKGYFTRGAQQLITLDDTQIVEQFKFDLPMLCTEFNVSCRHGSSQYCTQNDGRCKCKRGYYDVNPTQERSPNYTIDSTDPTKNIDGNDLTCLPLCQNDGEWNNETSTCKCQDGYNGEYCQVKDDCQVNRSSLCQGDNGYIAFTTLLTEDSEATTTITTPSCQDTKCQCYGQWINQSNAPNLDDLIQKKPKDYVARNGGCSICALKPISKEFYKKEQLIVIADYYSSTTGLSTQYNGNEDTIYSQTYQPSVDSGMQSHPLTQQRCYITGTQPTTYDDGNCTKCQCKRGYGGEYCQLHIAYANMTYTPTDGNDYIYDKTTEVLLFNKLTEELSLSMNNFDQTQMFVIQHNRDYHWVEIGLYTGLDFFIRNGEYNASIQQQQQQSEGYLLSPQQTTIPTGFNPTLLPTNLDSLYTQWDDLTTNFPTTPVKNQDTNDYLGPIDPPAVIQDPACFEQEIIGCSGDAPKRIKSYALLIGLLVGLLLAAILFILLVLLLLWCRRNQRGFWKSQEEQERDELSNFVPTQRQDFKGSTAAPSMTIGTTSIMPLNADGVELQSNKSNKTTTSAVQSASNHTEVVDPSLPPHIKAYKDAKGQVFYVDSTTITTSWDHPNAVKKEGEDDSGYDSRW